MRKRQLCLLLVMVLLVVAACGKSGEAAGEESASVSGTSEESRQEQKQDEEESGWMEPASYLVRDLQHQLQYMSSDDAMYLGLYREEQRNLTSMGRPGWGQISCYRFDLDGDGEEELLTVFQSWAWELGEGAGQLDVWQSDGQGDYTRVGELFLDASSLGAGTEVTIGIGEERENGWHTLYLLANNGPHSRMLAGYTWDGTQYTRSISQVRQEGLVRDGATGDQDLLVKYNAISKARAALEEQNAPLYTAAAQALDGLALALSQGTLPQYVQARPFPQYWEMETSAVGWADHFAGVRALMQYDMANMTVSNNAVTVPVVLSVEQGNDLLPQGAATAQVTIHVEVGGESGMDSFVTSFFINTDGRFIHHKDMPLMDPDEHPLLDQQMYRVIGYVMLYNGQDDPNLVRLEYKNLSDMPPQYLLPVIITRLDELPPQRRNGGHSHSRDEIVQAAAMWFDVEGFEPPENTVYGSGGNYALPGMGLGGNPPLGRYALRRMPVAGDGTQVTYRMYIYEDSMRIRVVNMVDFHFRLETDALGQYPVLERIGQAGAVRAASIFDWEEDEA